MGTLTVIVYRIPSLHHSGLLQFCTHVSTLPMIDPKMKKHCPHWGDPLPKLTLTLDKLPKLHFTHYSVRIAPARAKVEEVRNYLYDLSFFAPYCSMGPEASLRMSRSYILYFPVFGVVAQRNIKLTNIIPLKIILPQAMDA